MRFPYLVVPEPPGPLNPGGGIARPIIEIGVSGSRGEATVLGLIDTGADATILPAQLAEILGIEIEESLSLKISGIAGCRAAVGTGVVAWQLGQGGPSFHWTSRVGFMPFGPEDEAVILGYAGFLEYFVATFDGRARVLELTPADDFPATP